MDITLLQLIYNPTNGFYTQDTRYVTEKREM